MRKNKEFTDYEHIDICACYEPFEEPPADFLEECRRQHEPEPTLENTSFYVTELDGSLYFYCGNTRIKVTEHFADNGKQLDTLIEDVISYAGNTATKISVAC